MDLLKLVTIDEEPKIPILLEGPDASGKTSLARLIQKMNPDIRYYCSGGPPKSIEEMFRFCDEQLTLAHQDNIIIDRITPISHPIYNFDKLSIEAIEYLSDMLDKILLTHKSVLVYCRPSNEHLLNPKSHEWKEYDTPEHIGKILTKQHKFIEAYDQVMSVHDHVTANFENTDQYVELAALLAASEHTNAAREQLNYIIRVSNGILQPVQC